MTILSQRDSPPGPPGQLPWRSKPRRGDNWEQKLEIRMIRMVFLWVKQCHKQPMNVISHKQAMIGNGKFIPHKNMDG